MSQRVDEKYIWKIIENFVKTKGLVSTQIESFNEYINHGIQQVINGEADIQVEPRQNQRYVIHFGDVFVGQPSIIEDDRKLKIILPAEVRDRDLNYDAAICCDITETLYEDGKIIEEKKHRRVQIGRTPIMLRSDKCNLTGMTKMERIRAGECENDHGGYFIIKGNERVIVSQLRNAYNQVIVLKQKPGETYSHIAEMRSMSEETGHSVQIKAMIGSDNRTIVFSLPYINEYIPVGIVFKALGFTEAKDIISMIGLDIKAAKKYMRLITRDAFSIKSQDDALRYIGRYAMHVIPKEQRIPYARQAVETELFPHMGISATVKEKTLLLGYIVKKLLSTKLGIRSGRKGDEGDEGDDRDNYSFKRIETCGILCTELFKTLFKRFINTIKLMLEKKKSRLNAISIISRLNNITQGLKHCFATGNWGVQKNAYIRTGVSQVLSRMTYKATISHCRRIVIPVGKEAKNAKIRQIHQSQFGFVCPAETPEGQSAGIVLNYSLLSRVTRKIPTVLVKEVLENNNNVVSVSDVKSEDVANLVYVFLNGILIGMTENPDDLVDDLRRLRRIRRLDPDVSVTFDPIDNEVKVFCEAGRASRPLFTIGDDGLNIDQKVKKWRKLVRKNMIEYLDASEIENTVIAMTPNHMDLWENDYCEIHPSMMLGVIANTIPFADHNPSARNCFQCSMGKQALGIYAMTFKQSTDTIVHTLNYPQRALVSTKPADIMGFNDMPCGINVIVAIMTYTGFNQEDSVIVNQSAIDRGLFHTTHYRTISDTEKKGGMYSSETICVPPPNRGKRGQPGYFRRKNGNYSLLDERGVVRERLTVKKGDIIIGKIHTKSSKTGEETITDCSVAVKQGNEGVIDRVHVTITPDGYKLVKVVIRQSRVPIIGDKFASRYAQKGTIGITLRQEDLPFTADGIVPDIIVNPHAIPSRMTIGQLMECVLGKASALDGKFGDATPFTSSSTNNAAERICDYLSKVGMESPNPYNKSGWEIMYSGFTGERIKAKIFMGPTYYQRLKHMVTDKIHARAHGHVTTLTRQPLEGRSRDGGLRFGEMERDCMIAHGTSKFLQERLFDCSDPYRIIVCDKCGMVASSPNECLSCRTDRVSTCKYPYASKLLTQELLAMGIKVSIIPKK